jgi:hypothetical protein
MIIGLYLEEVYNLENNSDRKVSEKKKLEIILEIREIYLI